MRNLIAFLLRLALYMPLAALAYLCDGLRAMFERLSDGLFDMARATRQITRAPYVRKYDELLKQAQEDGRIALLNRLKQSLE